MESLYYVMAIMGCGDDGAACQQARVEAVRYENRAACQAAMSAALSRSTDLSFPVIQATCQQRGMVIAANGAKPRG